MIFPSSCQYQKPRVTIFCLLLIVTVEPKLSWWRQHESKIHVFRARWYFALALKLRPRIRIGARISLPPISQFNRLKYFTPSRERDLRDERNFRRKNSSVYAENRPDLPITGAKSRRVISIYTRSLRQKSAIKWACKISQRRLCYVTI